MSAYVLRGYLAHALGVAVMASAACAGSIVAALSALALAVVGTVSIVVGLGEEP